MTLTPSTLGATIRRVARDAQVRAVREARIASAPDSRGRCYVTVRSLTGDNLRHGPFPARHLHDHDGEDIVRPQRRDRCWLALDEGGDPAAIIAWEPRDA